MNFEKKQDLLDKLYLLIEKETTKKGMRMLNKIVTYELELEQECNI